MITIRHLMGTVVGFVVLWSCVSSAQAQATRTWVSGVGDDANPCSRTAPCKTFAGAISKTADGGEINVLDAGGFGAVTITKSITIDGGGSFASILASGTSGVIINDASPAGSCVHQKSMHSIQKPLGHLRRGDPLAEEVEWLTQRHEGTKGDQRGGES